MITKKKNFFFSTKRGEKVTRGCEVGEKGSGRNWEGGRDFVSVYLYWRLNSHEVNGEKRHREGDG